MSKLEWRNEQNIKGNQVLILTKKKGKISVQEVEEFLLREGGGSFNGYYAMIIKATESMCEVSGWMDEDKQGDMVELYPLYQGEDCPICSKLLPPFKYCPECGKELK